MPFSSQEQTKEAGQRARDDQARLLEKAEAKKIVKLIKEQYGDVLKKLSET